MDCRKQMYAQMRSLHHYRFPNESRSLVACELESYLKVLEPIMEQIRALNKEVLAARCSEEQLTKFERMLAIPVNKEVELEKRRAIVQNKMSIGPNDFHREGLERSLAAVGIKASVEDAPGSGTIVVTAREIADSSMTLDQAKEAFRALIPAHLMAEFVTGGISFEEFDLLGANFAQLNAMDKSFSQLEMMGMEEWQEEINNVEHL